MEQADTIQEYSLTLQLNARLQPIDRGDLFEDPLIEWLEESNLGYITGGGTALGELGEVSECDIGIALYRNDQETMAKLFEFVESLGAPKGSKVFLAGENDEVQQLAIGLAEGLALYLNGTDLPDEVYETGDINTLYNDLSQAIEQIGAIFSHWNGPRETAFYLYGVSFERLRAAIEPMIQAYPLCQKCRIEQIA
jgi:hypothetical protein